MASSGEQPAPQPAYETFVWIPAPPSPGATVVSNQIANPVTTTDISVLTSGVIGGTVTPALSQDITTMANVVPHDEFTATVVQDGTTQVIQAGGTTLTTVEVLEACEDTKMIDVDAASCSTMEPKYFTHLLHQVERVPVTSHKSNTTTTTTNSTNSNNGKKKAKVPRRRLLPAHREMIIDLVFNEKKTSREVARYMGLPQSTVMSVVQVFKKEHRIHKKTATGRKRRLTTCQEFQLFEMSQERDNVSVEEIRSRFLQLYPDFGHISKTTIYRTLERGKKGQIGMTFRPVDRYTESAERFLGPGKKKIKSLINESVESVTDGTILIADVRAVESITIEKETGRQRKSLSIAEREMIISLFFHENRTIREVSDVMHLAKSTVSSVVQVFKKEHRIQRKTSTGRKKKLSDQHELMIMDILAQKEDITIEETRNKFLNLNPGVPNISKSTIYRIMENCQTKLKARSDMEVFVGTFVHSTENDAMVILKDTVMGVLESKIEFMESLEELEQLKAEYGFTDANIHYMTASQFIIPGFIDTHTHAAQFPNNGVGTDAELLDWLERYTFPMEANFSDTLFARDVYTKTVDRLVRNGTTTACYFATTHLEGTKILADVMYSKGQRGFVGKTNQLRNCPEYYVEMSLADSLRDTEDFIRYVNNLQSNLVQPAVTPRFAPVCSEEQMQGLARLAQEYECLIQSHMSENQAEVNWVKEIFPWSKTYADVYDRTRLLGEKTVMAHCIHISDEEICVLRDRKVGVAVCSNSNLTLQSGICNVRKLLNSGIKVGLGTDCSGGYSTSMLESMRTCVLSSSAIKVERDREYQHITYKEAFRLATLGGAKVLNLEDKIGNFEIEKEFDALLIDVNVPNSPIDCFSNDNVDVKIQRFFYNGDDRNIIRVYVCGTKIAELIEKPSS